MVNSKKHIVNIKKCLVFNIYDDQYFIIYLNNVFILP